MSEEQSLLMLTIDGESLRVPEGCSVAVALSLSGRIAAVTRSVGYRERRFAAWVFARSVVSR